MTVDTIQEALLPQKDTDLVTHQIRINGNPPVTGTYQVISMTITEGVHKIPNASLVIRDGSASEASFDISDKGDFRVGNNIEILIGYHGKNDTVFKGFIISNSHRVNSNSCEINIECKDERARLTISNNDKHYEGVTDDEIIRELLDKEGLGPEPAEQDNGSEPAKDIKIGTNHESLVQSNTTDWDFIINRIDLNGGLCLIHNGKLTLKTPDLGESPTLYLVHGKDIIDLQLDLDSRVQTSDVEISAWDYSQQKVVTVKGEYPPGIETKRNADIEADNDTGIEETIKEFVGTVASILNKPQKIRSTYLTASELQLIANSKMLKQVLSLTKGRVKYQGSQKALAGSFINITGIGEQLNGKHFVSAIQHDYSDGCWTTEATLGWDDKFFAENINPHHPSSGTGQLSTVQGLHIAVVTNIEDNTGQYRVKVRLPLVSETEEGVYARVATIDAGNNRGSFFRPEVNDEVLVGFMNDDPRHPVILGMLHSSKKPSPLEPEKANDKKGFVSRSGIKILFDDGKKMVTIETPGSRTIEMDDNAGTITIKDSNSNKIVMDANGISIEAGKDLVLKAGKSISVSAPQVSIKADGAMTAEANGTMSVKSSGVTEIKGSLVTIN